MNIKQEEKFSISKMIKDILSLFIYALNITILYCICVQNGWVFTQRTISNEMFVFIYRNIICIIPFISAYHGFTGYYTNKITTFTLDDNNSEAKNNKIRKEIK